MLISTVIVALQVVTTTKLAGAATPSALAVGVAHACLLDSAGAVQCWGRNDRGQLGDGTTTDRATPTAVTGSTVFSSIAAGNSFTCGLTSAGAAYCWGSNSNGQLGDGTTTDHSAPAAVSGGLAFLAGSLSLGDNHACAIKSSNNFAYCWGANDHGKLGDGTTVDKSVPTKTLNNNAYLQVTAGTAFSCARSTNATFNLAYCWGSNGSGQQGNSLSTGDQTDPELTGSSTGFKTMAAGASHMCGKDNTVKVWCWGDNTTGQIGDGTTTQRNSDVQTAAQAYTLNTIISGASMSCGHVTSGIAYCWGANANGQLGTGNTTQSSIPVAVSGGIAWTSMAAKGANVCGIATTNKVYCWGANAYGQVGDGTTADKSAPTPVAETVPNTPSASSLAQYKSDGTTAVAVGGSTDEIQFKVSATVSDPDVGETVTLCVELRPVGVSFLNTFVNETCSPFVASSATAVATVKGLGANTSYHWQARTKDSYGIYSAWVSGGNGNAESAADIIGTSPGFVQIATGDQSNCGLKGDGAAYCWGYGFSGLGNNVTSDSIAPVAVSGGLTFSQIVAGGSTICGLTQVGAAYCWGYNTDSEVGDGTTTARLVPTAVSGGLTFGTLSMGANGACALTLTGSSFCWGFNTDSEIGDGTTSVRSTPTATSGGLLFTRVDRGLYATCAITTNAMLYCWGYGAYGQIGDGTLTTRSTPRMVSGGSSFVSVSVGYTSVCGTTSALGYCWGYGTYGQIGNGSTSNKTVPTSVGSAFGPIALGGYTACATLTTGGALRCWGSNAAGQIGDGTVTNRSAPTALTGTPSVVSLDAGTDYVCSLTKQGAVGCWGSNRNGQIGSAAKWDGRVPRAIPTPSTWTTLDVGGNGACGRASGVNYCWGNNASGQIGDATNVSRTTPTAISTSTVTLNSVKMGGDTTCGLDATGLAYCWGSNFFGQVGDGSGVAQSSPIAVAKPSGAPNAITFSSIATHKNTGGLTITCGVSTAGAGYCWGYGGGGNIGNGGTTTQNLIPVAVSGGLTFASISPGFSHTCGVTTANTLYCWGTNTVGQLGDGTTTSHYTPTLVSGSYTSVSAGFTSTCAIRTDSKVACWGDNSSGQLGIGSTTNALSPTLVSNSLTFSQLSVGTSSVCGLASGIVYCWGYNAMGQLGDGTTANKVLPTQILGNNTYTSVSTGGFQACALTASGTAYCWGGDQYGALGVGSDDNAYVYTYADQIPSDPSSPAQAKTTAGTPIVTGAWSNENSITFSATGTDTDTLVSDTVGLCVEIKPLGAAFDDLAAPSCGSQTASGGTPTVAIGSLTSGTDYHWRVRLKDSYGAYGNWVAYGSNAESAADARIDTANPVASTVYDGLGEVEATYNDGALDTLKGSWPAFTDGLSGISKYEYAIGTSLASPTDVQAFTDTSGVRAFTLSGLNLHTSQTYFVSVRATDGAGNTVTGVSAGQFVAPQFTTSNTSTTLDFGHLQSGQSAQVTTTISVNTNAFGGYKVLVNPTTLMSSSSSTIAMFNGGTVTQPDTYLSGDSGLGVTSDATSVGGTNLFQSSPCPGGSTLVGSGCYAPIPTSGSPLLIKDHTAAVSGAPVSESVTLTFKLTVPASQPAGNYSVPISYSVVPIF